MDDQLSCRLEALRRHSEKRTPPRTGAERRHILFFSCSDGTERAQVLTADGDTFDAAWQSGAEAIEASGTEARWLRVDWITAIEPTTWGALRSRLKKVKRNYFRQGISLDEDFRHAFLEAEINANAMLYGGNQEPAAIINERNFAIYARKRHGVKTIDFADDTPVWIFATGGAFIDRDDPTVHPIGAGLDAGRREIGDLDSAGVRSVIDAGSSYLASQVRDDGRFHYGWHPCFDREIETYNTLRHASSVYAMLEAWAVTRDPALRKAIDRSLACLVDELIVLADLPDGTTAAFLREANGEVKLGGNGVAILALTKHAELTGETRYDALLEQLGCGILFMQDPATGAFRHVLAYPGLETKEAFRTIYYEGEAAFALMRLYARTGHERWLAAVERAFDHFIAQEHWRHHDHWLSYCVNELTKVRPQERYYRFGLANFDSYLDFVLERITTFPTLLELMMAAHEMVARIAQSAEHRHLLQRIDLEKFYRALHHRAHYLLNGHFWPELAMYFANPAKIVGSFFIRHHAFRVRIDDVEHYLSGLIAYLEFLRQGQPVVAGAPAEAQSHWRERDVVVATGGRWLETPAPDWTASGVCIASMTFRQGDMVAVKAGSGPKGVAERLLPRLANRAAAWIAEDHAVTPESGPGKLIVEDVQAGVLGLGRYARAKMTGKVVAVTGSAGKTTTVAMLSHALATCGAVGTTRHNANLPLGIAWNLASIPWDVPHVVLELAIGRMAQNARLAQPDVAVFTNVLPAHLEYHKDLATIASRKSAIFSGMAPGKHVVLNREISHWEHIHMAAVSRGLTVIHYGSTSDCDVRLVEYSHDRGEVVADVRGEIIKFRIGVQGEHMALNSLAVLGCALALELDPAGLGTSLETFEAVSGRCAVSSIELSGRKVEMIDDSYNANPGSMAEALKLLGHHPHAQRRVAVLGEMLELGEDAREYHRQLAPQVIANGIDLVHAMGDLYENFWSELPAHVRGIRSSDLEEFRARVVDDLRDGDTLLLKGSHGSKVHCIAASLREMANPN